MQNWTDLNQPPPPLKPDVYVSWAKIYPQEFIKSLHCFSKSLSNLTFIPLRPFIPFLTPHLILNNQILQPVLHLYIDITHCIFPIPHSHFLIVLLFLLLLHCYTVYLYTRIKLINVILLAVPGRTASQCRRTV